jgi:hypothetical protein
MHLAFVLASLQVDQGDVNVDPAGLAGAAKDPYAAHLVLDLKLNLPIANTIVRSCVDKRARAAEVWP